ncbi:hydrogenase nickel incorporation protein HypB [uncultured Roseivirga sp.]|jgi:hydrogenase nickel incorporation protein HypB|uniref:hydrogenase nickel incorporation protein HypB n=1 Tax=Ekhidna sp. TaxID=2608089 RepID=UPI00258A678D|nr:hydrogenase nickel incorporation protein HypB [uncultured Roseivirga sp.]|tara:strand:+ start:7355 stop:8071 length:717 start_codon:yes stop_codon:yes gene_type:complete
MAVEKSTKAARGTVQCNNSSFNLLKANDFVADTIRKFVAEKQILLINITSSAGSGKTTLMQETAKRLSSKIKMKVLVGDLETERDADRIKEAGVEAYQIVTGGICHLEAQMVWQAMEQIDLEGVELLFVENVGNLVCPSSFDLGEDYRVTLLASTEGDDKPKKYPKMFYTSDLMLVSKADLLPYIPFSVEAAIKDARDVNPEIEALQISSTSGEGIDEWCSWLEEKVKLKKESKNMAV